MILMPVKNYAEMELELRLIRAWLLDNQSLKYRGLFKEHLDRMVEIAHTLGE